ncbi:YgjV family protein [Actinomyces qiguomingii]|uniref:YgjV family protein n=1 Tax=Actinomyces qiguomingii TaxID=2057800 RepID=UPI000CA03B22|nr:YgjV family protein [Actinomyces qiguomingii]
MDTRTLLEMVGWIGSGLVVISLVVANQRTFRGLNLTGSLVATAYNMILGVWPAVGMNATIALIDLYWLLRLHGVIPFASATPATDHRRSQGA